MLTAALLSWLVAGSAAFPGPADQSKARAELFARPAPGGLVQVAIRVRIDPGWHLYHDELGQPDSVGKPTTVELSGAEAWSRVRFPEPFRSDQPGIGEGDRDTWIWAHEGTIELYALGRLASGASPEGVSARIGGLTCQDDGSCIAYSAAPAYAGAGPDALFTSFPADLALPAPGEDPKGAGAEIPPDAGAAQQKSQQGLLAFLALAVFWGAFTLLMPCTYPMIPITISFFTKQAAARPGKQISLSLAYGLGIVLIFILIGALFGSVIYRFATNPATNLVFGAAFVLFAFALFGAVDLQPPAFLMNAAGRARATGGYLGVFLMGATLVVTSFTCTAPFVGSLITVGASQGLGRVVLGMGVFGLTMAVPFVFLALVPAKIQAMPRSGEWMHTLKVSLGFVELAAALKFLSNADLVWKWEVLNRELFLVLWCGIFLATALFLFGLVRMKDESHEGIGPLRMVSALFALLFALYCGWGALGHRLDQVMTAIIPDYSADFVTGAARGQGAERGHEIVKDDYEGALALAQQQRKLVLVNFTGHT